MNFQIQNNVGDADHSVPFFVDRLAVKCYIWSKGDDNMEFAMWKGKKISAHKVSKDFDLKTKVKLASSKELFCPDPECENPRLRFCSGEIKRPYFAHVCNTNCDYGEYDKTNSSEIKDVCQFLYEHFVSLGYDVNIETKVLRHHYAHILIKNEQGKHIVIELGDKTTTARYINRISEEYKNKGFFVRWIYVGELSTPKEKEKLYYLKEYSLNKSTNNDLIIIDPKTKEIGQYKIDETKYIIAGKEVRSENYPKTYECIKTIEELVVEDNEVTIKNFYKDYDEWHTRKVKKFEEKKEEEEKERIEREKKWQEEQKKRERATIMLPNTHSHRQYKKPIKPSYEERKQEIMSKINQTTDSVYDSLGIRWVKCEECGKIDEEMKFLDIGGPKRSQTQGVCRDCCNKN